MNKLLIICLALWIAPLLGKQYVPEIFDSWLIQWPAMIFLSLLLPIGFARALSNNIKSETKSFKSISEPVSFLFIFCSLLLMQLPAHYVSTTLYSIEPISVASDTEILDALSIADTEENRRISAQIIFSEYGRKVPYKLDSGEFITYEPTEADKSKFDEFKKQKEEMANYKSIITTGSIQTIYWQAFEIVCFFFLFTITLLVNNRKSLSVSKSNV